MASAARRGAMIVLEGSDRVGKSTQAHKLIEALSTNFPSENFQLFKYPDRTTSIGQVINKYLLGEQQLDDHVIHLLFSANRWEHDHKIRKLLSSGTNLIIDRYAYSGVAYSSAKNGMDFNWCKSSDVGLVKPDVVIYLDLPNESVVYRNGFGGEIYEKKSFQEIVKNQFKLLIEDNWKVNYLMIKMINFN